MRKSLFILLMVLSIPVYGQLWNPYVSSVYITESPINLSEGENAVLTFNIGNGGMLAMSDLSNPLRAVVTLSGVEPRNIQDIYQSVSGANFFNVVYFEDINTLYFEQNQNIPTALMGGVNEIEVLVKVNMFSSQGQPRNGFQINLIPPAYASSYNNLEDDKAEVMTYTINSLLPVELTEFIVELDECDVNIKWQTASETNNKEFRLEKSLNSLDWVVLKTVQGYGNSVIPRDYEVLDREVSGTDVVYYRLVQEDFDGTESSSKIISLQIKGCDQYNFVFYPNPANDVLFVKNSSSKERNVELEFYSSNGQIVKKYEMRQSLEVIDLSKLVDGTYFVRLIDKNANTSKHHQFVIQR